MNVWRAPRDSIIGSLMAGLLALTLVGPAFAGPREQAKRMHDRLVGVPPSEGVLTSMQATLASNDPDAVVTAAYQAMSHPLFYSSTLKNFVTPWTNEEQTIFSPLNDYTATVIGIIRDDRPFTDILSADVIYVGAQGTTNSPYSHTDNDHYEQLDDNLVDLSDPTRLVAVTQSGLPGSMLGANDAAGVLTTRAAGEAFLKAGTNRRMWRFIAVNHLCRDMEQLNDITRPADRVRQDITRSPGGDSRIFHNTCVGCHAGMDPLAEAFAYFEWDDEAQRVIYTAGEVQPKYLINDTTFPYGYVTTDDRWDNFWRVGPNAVLGWRGQTAGGNGPKSLGMEVANSRAFSECQVEKTFERLCLRPPGSPADRAEIQRVADIFESTGYRMKRVFAETVGYCLGE